MHAYRPDIADIALAGQLFAPHYARPMVRACGAKPVLLRPIPSADAPPSSELLPGEEFAVLDITGGWAWGYCRHDHYVGYLEAAQLVEARPATHVVAAPQAPILPEPNIHAPSLASLPLASRVTGQERDGFLATDIGYLPFTHLRELPAVERDPVAVAERLVGSPYLMGGRTSAGIDCSGLVQVALSLCGIPSPRDSDQQRALGNFLPEDRPLTRGDLVFFPGHVGFMADEERLIHATGNSGDVIVEPLEAVTARTQILERRRL